MTATADDVSTGKEPAKVVATSGSPSTNTELTLDLAEDANESRLIGGLVGLSWNQFDAGNESGEPAPRNSGGHNTAVLGQITSIEMRNRWHEDQTFKNIVKTRGELPAITKLQDTRTATMKVGGCFVKSGDSYGHADLGSVPATGIKVNLVRQSFLDDVLSPCADDLFYLGQDYAGNINFPMWFKHFGSGDGVGEAYHTGIFGKTGSGKTGLAKMLLAAYARHPDMGILVIDPQGEITLALKGKEAGDQGLGLKDAIDGDLGRDMQLLELESIQLDDFGLFEELFEESPMIRQDLSIRGSDNVAAAIDVALRFVRKKGLENLARKRVARDFLLEIKRSSGEIYNGYASQQALETKVDELSEGPKFDEFCQRRWAPIASLFSKGGRKQPGSEIVRQLIESRAQAKPIFILNLQGTATNARMNEAIQRRIISHIANAIVEGSAESLGTEDTANTLVVLDEAHRFAPSAWSGELTDEARMLRSELKRAVRETRKYGVGWMFISQTMMGLDTELLMQLRTMFFGYGLAFGLEFQRLRELAGGDADAMNLYRSFRDPQSAMDAESKRFPFMAIGPISPMPFSGQPMFFSAFNGADFMAANRGAFKRAAKSRRNVAADNGKDGSTTDGDIDGAPRSARPSTVGEHASNARVGRGTDPAQGRRRPIRPSRG